MEKTKKEARETREMIELKAEMTAFVEELVQAEVKKQQDKQLPEKLKRVLNEVLSIPLTAGQVARLTGRSKESIYKMAQRGTIPSVKVNGVVHFEMSVINDYLL